MAHGTPTMKSAHHREGSWYAATPLASETTIRALIESASEGILILGAEGCIELVNSRIEEIFGYPRDELLGERIELLIPVPQRAAHAGHCAHYYHDPQVRAMGVERHLYGQRKNGSLFPVDVSLSYVKHDGQVTVLSFVADITQRKKAEESQRRYAQELEEMVEERTAALREAQARLLAQQQLQQELELAEEVQASLLPTVLPSFDGFEFAARALPARYVSGDVYDWFPGDAHGCHIVLADIAGKGISAALLTSTTRALLRAEVVHTLGPADILANVNASLYDDLTHAERFVTVFLAHLNTQSGELVYANAGHAEGLWYRGAHRPCRRLSGTGLPLGIVRDSKPGEESVRLRPGDVLVFYSDGVTEAMNEAGEFFDSARLDAIVSAHADRSADDLAGTIVDTVEAFRGGLSRSDDVTLVVVKALPRLVSRAFPAVLDRLHDITGLVHTLGLAYGAGFAYRLELATSEIVTNVIRHAYRARAGEVRCEITLLPDRIAVDLYDTGEAFDPAGVPTPDPKHPREGGYGLAIARQVVDELVYTPATPGGNHWHLTKRAPAADTTDA
ncbi:MAG TPA: SpoIIE family protein phosphatase [Anaerolineae bacterium]|nr:SpoIIE family protein phosphatase [Anaerolineae bacterium]